MASIVKVEALEPFQVEKTKGGMLKINVNFQNQLMVSSLIAKLTSWKKGSLGGAEYVNRGRLQDMKNYLVTIGSYPFIHELEKEAFISLIAESMLFPDKAFILYDNETITIEIKKDEQIKSTGDADLRKHLEEEGAGSLFLFSGIDDLRLLVLSKDIGLRFVGSGNLPSRFGEDKDGEDILWESPVFLGQEEELSASVQDIPGRTSLYPVAALEELANNEKDLTHPSPQSPADKRPNKGDTSQKDTSEEEGKKQEASASKKIPNKEGQDDLQGDLGNYDLTNADLLIRLESHFTKIAKDLGQSLTNYNTEKAQSFSSKPDMMWLSEEILEKTIEASKKCEDYVKEGASPINVLPVIDSTISARSAPEMPDNLILPLHKRNVATLEGKQLLAYACACLKIFDYNYGQLFKHSKSKDYSRAVSHYLLMGLVNEEWRSKIRKFNTISYALKEISADYTLLPQMTDAEITEGNGTKGLHILRTSLIVAVVGFAKCGRGNYISKVAFRTLVNGIHSASAFVSQDDASKWTDTTKTKPYSDDGKDGEIVSAMFSLSNQFLNITENLPSGLILMTSLASMGGFSKALGLRLDGLKAPYKIILSYLYAAESAPYLLQKFRDEMKIVFTVGTNIAINPFAYNRCWSVGRAMDDKIENKDVANLTAYTCTRLIKMGHSSIKGVTISQKLRTLGQRGIKHALNSVSADAYKELTGMMDSFVEAKLIDVFAVEFNKLPNAPQMLQIMGEPVNTTSPTSVKPEIVGYMGQFLEAADRAYETASIKVNKAEELGKIVKAMEDAAKVSEQIKAVVQSQTSQQSIQAITEDINGLFDENKVHQQSGESSSAPKKALIFKIDDY